MIETSLVDQKIDKLKEIFAQINANEELTVEDNGEGGKLVYGPFPSFIILVEEFGACRALIHVNADAPNMMYIFNKFDQYLDIAFDGPFAVNGETGKLILGPDSYAKKEENILMFAAEIFAKRKEQEGLNDPNGGLYVPEEKKIIIA